MIKKIFNLMLLNPIHLVNIFFDKLRIFYISFNKNIEVRGRLFLSGKPLIDIKSGSKLILGANITLNSRNLGYHINMHSSIKLFAESGSTIIIGDNTRIHGTCIHACNLIKIGENCLIAANCQIIDNNGHDLSFSNVKDRINTNGVSKPIIIEDNVWIGANSIILPGVTIGNGSIISANSVVAKSIPSMVIAGGNPAVILKRF